MLRRLVANWELKILSVVIAFALWLVVVGSGKSQLATPAIVEYTGLGADLVLVGRPRDSVQVELEASRWAVAPLSPDLVEAPPGVTVRRVTPNRLPVTLAAAVAKTLQVVPQIRGAPEPDHVIHRVTVEPSTVQIKGPRSTIEGRTTVETVPVDIAGRRETVSQSVGLALPESVYLTDQRKVQVTVEIKAEGPMRGARGEGASR